jgi:hypothetical protein
MDSKITETPRFTDSPRSVAIPFNIEGLNESNMCDLNKVFQINFTYNVDLLKSLLEGILKFQKSAEEELEAIKEDNKEKNMKIRKLESKLSSLGGVSNPNLIKIDINDSKLDEKKQKKVENLLIPENDNENKARITIHNPRDDKIILETSESNSDIINKIIVSNKY